MNSSTLLAQGFSLHAVPPKDGPKPKNPLGRYLLSASQISTYASCQRKWAWRYVAGILEPSKPAAELGGRVHAILEAWLASGVAPDPSTHEGRIALAGIKHLPPPGSGMVERGFILHSRRNSYLGYVDFQYLSAQDLTVTILDHKTTSSLRYAKTPEELLVDIQALIYALYAFLAWNVSEVTLKWVYYTTANVPRSPPPVVAKVHLPVVLERFADIERLGDEIVYHAQNKTHPLALKPTASTCGAYGGCPHKSICNLSEDERLRSIMSEATMAEKLGMVPVHDPNTPQTQQSFPQWAGAPMSQAAPPPPPNPFAQQAPQPVQGNDGRMYLQQLDGSWVPVEQQPMPMQAPQFQPPAPQMQMVPQAPQPQIVQQMTPQQSPGLPTFNAPEGPATNPVEIQGKRGRGRPAGTGTAAKKLDKLEASKIAFLAGAHAAVLAGSRDSAQIQAAGDVCLLAFQSKFGA